MGRLPGHDPRKRQIEGRVDIDHEIDEMRRRRIGAPQRPVHKDMDGAAPPEPGEPRSETGRRDLLERRPTIQPGLHLDGRTSGQDFVVIKMQHGSIAQTRGQETRKCGLAAARRRGDGDNPRCARAAHAGRLATIK